MSASFSSAVNTLSRGKFGHLHPDALDAFARGEVPASPVTTAHLARCPRCRDEVVFRRSAAAGARTMRAPEASDALLSRVLSRYEAGERSILPEDARMPARSGRIMSRWVAVAAAAGLIIGVGIVRPRESTAGTSEGELQFSDTLVHPGGSVRATYRAALDVGNPDSLQLRAHYYTRESQAYGRMTRLGVAATLRRDDKGLYLGTFVFPIDAVYASFAVETADGAWVDSHERHFWQIAERSARNERAPTFEALTQRMNDNLGRSWEGTISAAREATQRYPERAGSWSSLAYYERYVLGDAAADSLLPAHHAHLRSLHATLSAKAKVPALDMGDMFFYAGAVHDSAIGAYWHDRLKREWPMDPITVQNRIVDLPVTVRTDSVRALAAYERLYREHESTPTAFARQGETLLRFGFWAAIAAKNADAAELWGARFLRFNHSPEDSTWVSARIVDLPSLRGKYLDRLRALALSAVDARLSQRPLSRTIAEWRHEIGRDQAGIIATIGHELVAAGSPRAGADSLEIAGRRTWSMKMLGEAAEAWKVAGDPTRAAQNLARIAVDPSTSRTGADSLARVLHADSAQWTAWTGAAREEMRAIVLQDGTRMALRGDPLLESVSGKRSGLRSLVNGAPTLVTFWSRFCAPSAEQLPRLEKLWADLHARGIGVVAITDEPFNPALRQFIRDKGLTVPIYVDVRGEATKAFSNFGTPSYHILDGQSVVRFKYPEFDAILRDATLLLPERLSER